jgi:riboflavin kinase/FMN adenylyltransferase
MLITKRLNRYGRQHPGSVVALGLFDGLHRGHRAIIERTAALARRRGHQSAVVTFDPPPQAVLAGNQRTSFLMSLAEKEAALERMGIDVLAVIKFSRAVAAMDPRRFVDRVLVETLHASAVVCGTDCGFGRHRSGNLPLLEEMGRERGFSVIGMTARRTGAARISSSAIRTALTAGDLAAANRMLGLPYQLTGSVVRGKRVGRTIGYPTANVRPDYRLKLIPCDGVYAATAAVGGRRCDGMLYIGVRPTVRGGRSIEFHALDRRGDWYGRPIVISLLRYIRRDRRFPDLAALQRQIGIDERSIRRFFERRRTG